MHAPTGQNQRWRRSQVAPAMLATITVRRLGQREAKLTPPLLLFSIWQEYTHQCQIPRWSRLRRPGVAGAENTTHPPGEQCKQPDHEHEKAGSESTGNNIEIPERLATKHGQGPVAYVPVIEMP